MENEKSYNLWSNYGIVFNKPNNAFILNPIEIHEETEEEKQIRILQEKIDKKNYIKRSIIWYSIYFIFIVPILTVINIIACKGALYLNNIECQPEWTGVLLAEITLLYIIGLIYSFAIIKDKIY